MAGIDNKRPDDWATYFWAGDREEPEVGGQLERSFQETFEPQSPATWQADERPAYERPRVDQSKYDAPSQPVQRLSDDSLRADPPKKPRKGVTSKRTLTFIGVAILLNIAAAGALFLTNNDNPPEVLGVEVIDTGEFADEDSLRIEIPLNPEADIQAENTGVAVDPSLTPLRMVIDEGALKLQGTATSDAQADLMVQEASIVFADVPLVKEYVVNAAAPPPNQGVVVQKPVVFQPGSAVIREEFHKILDACADVMRQNPTLVMNVSGHTDSDGSVEYNIRLAEARAKAVIDYYAGQGLDRAKFSLNPMGETAPIASNESDVGKATNRRTDLEFEGIFDDVIQESGS